MGRRTGKIFLVNSLTEIALSERAQGVHLTSDQDLSSTRLLRRQWKRPDFLLGKSAHSFREAVLAQEEGADYVLLGPIFAPISKASASPPLGLELLRKVAGQVSIPVFTVGGILKDNFAAVLEAGSAGPAGISWLASEVEDFLR